MNGASAWVGVVMAAGVGAAALGCRQIAGIGNASAPVTSACGLPYGEAACAACASASCCAQSMACTDDEGCSSYQSCLAPCQGSPSCRADCTVQDYQFATSAAVSALSACLVSHCESACGLTCGGVAAYVAEPAQASTCAACLQGDPACGDARAWASSQDGDAYWRCVMACTTPDCRFACATAHPQGQALFDVFYDKDFSGTCSTACGYGSYWACLGRVAWPTPAAGTVIGPGARAQTDLSFTVLGLNDNGEQGVWPGASVAICSACPCPGTGNDPWWEGTSDDAGTVDAAVPYLLDTQGLGLDGCMQIASPASSSLTPLVPTMCYWDFPLSEPSATLASNEGCLVESVAQEVGVAQAAGYAVDPNRSAGVVAAVFDCLGSPASGVTLSLSPPAPPDSGAVSFYGLVGENLEQHQTGPDGVAGVLNVAVASESVDASAARSNVTLTATPLGPDGGPMQPSSIVTVAIQAGAMTEALMFPTPPP